MQRSVYLYAPVTSHTLLMNTFLLTFADTQVRRLMFAEVCTYRPCAEGKSGNVSRWGTTGSGSAAGTGPSAGAGAGASAKGSGGGSGSDSKHDDYGTYTYSIL